MSTRFCMRLVDGPISGSWAAQQVAGNDAGALTEFRGTVRDEARGRSVLRIEYQAYPRMVEAELARIAEGVFAEHDVLRIAVEHATGTVQVGECSVVVVVASAHRAAAYAANAAFMDRLKASVPIWKHEFYADGSDWIGQGS